MSVRTLTFQDHLLKSLQKRVFKSSLRKVKFFQKIADHYEAMSDEILPSKYSFLGSWNIDFKDPIIVVVAGFCFFFGSGLLSLLSYGISWLLSWFGWSSPIADGGFSILLTNATIWVGLILLWACDSWIDSLRKLETQNMEKFGQIAIDYPELLPFITQAIGSTGSMRVHHLAFFKWARQKLIQAQKLDKELLLLPPPKQSMSWRRLKKHLKTEKNRLAQTKRSEEMEASLLNNPIHQALLVKKEKESLEKALPKAQILANPQRL